MAYLHFSWVAEKTHFVYLPLIGLVGLFTAAWEIPGTRTGMRGPGAAMGVLALAAAGAIAGTRRHARLTRESVLWPLCSPVCRASSFAHNNLATGLDSRKQIARGARSTPRAAIRLQTDYIRMPTYTEDRPP